MNITSPSTDTTPVSINWYLYIYKKLHATGVSSNENTSF